MFNKNEGKKNWANKQQRKLNLRYTIKVIMALN